MHRYIRSDSGLPRKPRNLRRRRDLGASLLRAMLTGALVFAVANSAAGKPIYQCNERAFTDVGCQANRAGQPVSPDTPISLYAAPAIRKTEQRPATQSKAKPKPDDRRATRSGICASIRQSLSQLKTRRRRGYSSDTEARLDAREAALRAQQRESCLLPTVRASGS